MWVISYSGQCTFRIGELCPRKETLFSPAPGFRPGDPVYVRPSLYCVFRCRAKGAGNESYIRPVARNVGVPLGRAKEGRRKTPSFLKSPPPELRAPPDRSVFSQPQKGEYRLPFAPYFSTTQRASTIFFPCSNVNHKNAEKAEKHFTFVRFIGYSNSKLSDLSFPCRVFFEL